MKKSIFFLFLICMATVSCKKFAGDDLSVMSSKKTIINLDTIPDGGFLKLRIQHDSSTLDETILKFEHAASPNYDEMADARYFPGFGTACLASLTADSVPCAIQCLPYVVNKPVSLHVGSRCDDTFILRISAVHNIPGYIHVWLKDRMLKDSLDLRTANYTFNVTLADTNSFGTRRFAIVLR